ncbi:hypothetical protein GLE_2546 [Lysobacter enzymogenes]|uniref:Uncharacterized protein n=1 Tax=Lysobacter enzymogenes TaxID=69 RepID=A0A0S2DGX6_LYSEN|nr:hypothetical protein GLE_2546 [Lysobacter enzymogenes]
MDGSGHEETCRKVGAAVAARPRASGHGGVRGGGGYVRWIRRARPRRPQDEFRVRPHRSRRDGGSVPRRARRFAE